MMRIIEISKIVSYIEIAYYNEDIIDNDFSILKIL